MEKGKLLELLADMTIEEKIGQLVQLGGMYLSDYAIPTGSVEKIDITEDEFLQIGSVLGEHGAKWLMEVQDRMMKAQPHNIPALFMTDIIHGYKTAFPVPIAQGSSFNFELTRRICEATAKEAAAAGIHVTFSPMVDVSRDARWGRCMESTGEDKWLNARFAESSVKGFQGENIKEKGKLAACVKHFAGYGASGSGRDYFPVELSKRTLLEDYLPPYQAAIEAGVSMVMTSFNTLDRIPCTTNKWLMRDILRHDMGFDGVLISDYAAIDETVTHGSSFDKGDAAKQAILAGCDIDMASDCYIRNLENLVKSGEISEKLIDEAVLRILMLKNDLGLFENPYKDASIEDERLIALCDEHKRLSREAAEESIVMLKNDGILPLEKGKTVAVIGSLALSKKITGSWALFADESHVVTLKSALEELYPETDFIFLSTDTLCLEITVICEQVDAVIIVIGEDEDSSGESRSRTDITLFKNHKQIFELVYKINPNIVTVLFGGRPLAVPNESEKSRAMLMAFLPGTCGAYAIADIIFGKVNPSAKLSMSFPYSTGQLPITYSTFNTGRPKQNDNDEFIRFISNYMDAPNKPLYPFGHGLSFTKFEYSKVNLSSDTLTNNGNIVASVTVKNTGEMAGKEVVQLYIRDVKASVVRPIKELKGVQKIYLEADEERLIEFEICEEMLRFYDINMDFVSEAGEFIVWIDGSSETENSAKFSLE